MIDRNYWLNFHFEDDVQIDIECPTCGKGRLNILDKIAIRQTKDAMEILKQEYFNYDIEFLEEKFSGLLTCDLCKDVVAVCGTSFPDHDNDEEGSPTQYYKRFNPEYFSPSLIIFKLKPEYPKKVNETLVKSFSLFFVDNESCGNKIRISVEELLNVLEIKRESEVLDKPKKIILHKRIEQYKKTNPFVGELMLSIKWIGNFGSHDSLSRSDLLDAYEMLQAILDNVFDNQENKLMKLAKKINDNKRPASKIFPSIDSLNS